MKKIHFPKGHYIYSLASSTETPFNRRSVPTAKSLLRKDNRNILLKNLLYRLSFSNASESFLKRGIDSHPKKQDKKALEFLSQDKLIANDRVLDVNLSLFFRDILNRLKKNPDRLFSEAARFQKICHSESFEIPHIQAFDAVSDWDEFIELLESISKNRDRDRLSLFLSLLVQYAARCRPLHQS